jgi:hypothetical protein
MAKSEVYVVRVNDNDDMSAIAAKSARLFRDSGLMQRFGAEQLVAVKQHFGEDPKGHFIKPQITAEYVKLLKHCGARPFLTDTATLYVGGRSDGQKHAETAARHGFTYENVGACFIPTDGLMGIDAVAVKIDGIHYEEVKIASAAYHADAALILTHITGHCAAGYGGAIKNLGMGLASRSGKMLQHFQAVPKEDHDKCTACGACVRWCPADAIEIVSEGDRRYAHIDPEKCIGCGECLGVCRFDAMNFDWSVSGQLLSERMVEHALGFVTQKWGKAVYVNYAVEVTQNCDCMKAEAPVLPAVGIVAGTDVLACEQATIDLINEKVGEDLFKKLWPEYEYDVQLAYAEKLGMGSREYTLVEL